MEKQIIWFRRSDGVLFSADEGSETYKFMRSSSSFEETSDPAAPPVVTDTSETTSGAPSNDAEKSSTGDPKETSDPAAPPVVTGRRNRQG